MIFRDEQQGLVQEFTAGILMCFHLQWCAVPALPGTRAGPGRRNHIAHHRTLPAHEPVRILLQGEHQRDGILKERTEGSCNELYMYVASGHDLRARPKVRSSVLFDV